MQYKDIKSNGDINRVVHKDTVLWSRTVKLTPAIGKGDRSNRILVSIDVPSSRNGFTLIHLNYDEIRYTDCSDLEFRLSDSRFFGWKINESGNYISYGTSDGISGSPTSGIEIHSVDEDIYKIEINLLFIRAITEADIRGIRVTAEYVEE